MFTFQGLGFARQSIFPNSQGFVHLQPALVQLVRHLPVCAVVVLEDPVHLRTAHHHHLRVGVAEGVGFCGLECRILRFGVWGFGCGVWDVGCGVWGVECGVWGLGCGV